VGNLVPGDMILMSSRGESGEINLRGVGAVKGFGAASTVSCVDHQVRLVLDMIKLGRLSTANYLHTRRNGEKHTNIANKTMIRLLEYS